MNPMDDMQDMSMTFLHVGQFMGLEGSVAHSSSEISSLGAALIGGPWFSTSVSVIDPPE